MIDLTILICAVHTRYDTFTQKIQKQIWDQYNSLSDKDKGRVEIEVFIDNKKQILGRKRNLMVDMSLGKYVVFIDDDDRISDDYIATLLAATLAGADVIVFQASVTIDGGSPRLCHYSKDIKSDYDTPQAYYRLPNHICCVKQTLAATARFPELLFREDIGYSISLLPLLHTQHVIDRVLYHYDFNSATTETRV